MEVKIFSVNVHMIKQYVIKLIKERKTLNIKILNKIILTNLIALH